MSGARTIGGWWSWIGCGSAAFALAALVTGSVVAASAAAPLNTRARSITGSPTVGKDLTGNQGTWKLTSAWTSL